MKKSSSGINNEHCRASSYLMPRQFRLLRDYPSHCEAHPPSTPSAVIFQSVKASTPTSTVSLKIRQARTSRTPISRRGCPKRRADHDTAHTRTLYLPQSPPLDDARRSKQLFTWRRSITVLGMPAPCFRREVLSPAHRDAVHHDSHLVLPALLSAQIAENPPDVMQAPRCRSDPDSLCLASKAAG